MKALRPVSLALVLIAIIAGAIAGVYFLPADDPAERTARYLPPDTLIYLSVDLSHEPGQKSILEGIYKQFNEDDVINSAIDDLLGEIEAESTLNLREDILPWLEPELSVGVLHLGEVDDQPELVIFAATSDPEATRRALAQVLKSVEAAEGAVYRAGDYRGHGAYSLESGPEILPPSLAVTDDYLVMATGQQVIEDVIDLMEAPGPSLFDNAEFQEARAAAEEPRFAFYYLDAGALPETVLGQFGLPFGGVVGPAPPGLFSSLSGVISGSVSAIDRGIKLVMSSDTPPDQPGISQSGAAGSAARLPQDTLAFVSVGSVPELWKELKSQLGGEPNGALPEELFPQMLGAELGVDLEDALISWMSGELSVALLPPVVLRQDVPIVHALALVGYDDGPAAKQKLEGLFAIAEGLGAGAVERVDLDGVEAVVLELAVPGVEGYRPGYLLLDDVVVIGATLEALRQAVAVNAGVVPALSSAPGYVRALKAAGEPAGVSMYASMARLQDEIVGFIESTGEAIPAAELGSLAVPIDSVLAASSADGEMTRFQVIVTFE